MRYIIVIAGWANKMSDLRLSVKSANRLLVVAGNWMDTRRHCYILGLKINKCITGAGFMNRRRLRQLTAVILTSDLTTRMWFL